MGEGEDVGLAVEAEPVGQRDHCPQRVVLGLEPRVQHAQQPGDESCLGGVPGPPRHQPHRAPSPAGQCRPGAQQPGQRAEPVLPGLLAFGALAGVETDQVVEAVAGLPGTVHAQ
ncbi:MULTISPECIES: hypothetical protein [Streptomyces]|uniref:hypothetical protein n=1 Tax=Streptomyces TaxID=1883 RepID=UPI003322D5BF